MLCEALVGNATMKRSFFRNGKRCGHKRCSSGVAYDDSYCDNLRASIGSNSEKNKNVDFGPFSPELLPSEAPKICCSNYHHSPYHFSGHTPFHTTLIGFLMILKKDSFVAAFPSKSRARMYTC